MIDALEFTSDQMKKAVEFYLNSEELKQPQRVVSVLQITGGNFRVELAVQEESQ